LEGLEIEADGGDGSLQFVRDRIDEGIVLLVPADFTHQENRVEHHAADDAGEQKDAKKEKKAGAPIEQNPANVEEERNQDEAGAEGNEQRNRLAALGGDHVPIVTRGRGQRPGNLPRDPDRRRGLSSGSAGWVCRPASERTYAACRSVVRLETEATLTFRAMP